MRTQKQNSGAKVVVKNETTKQKVQKVEATYLERMQTNKNLLCNNLSQLFKSLKRDTTLPKLEYDFEDFKKCMLDRYEGKTPKKGFSRWYALQWAEKFIKEEAQNGNKIAKNYLLKTKAQIQEEAQKMY
jgi:hypothetical protein